MRLRPLACSAVLLLASCPGDDLVRCGDLVCPSGSVCAGDDLCVTADQEQACSGIAATTSCTYDTGDGSANGFCYDSACVSDIHACGDGFLDPETEQCDCGSAALRADYPMDAQRCNGENSSLPDATCRPDCTLARCGDGVKDSDEACDDGSNLDGDGCNAHCTGRFAIYQTPTSYNFDACATSSGSDVWVVGGFGSVVHYDGTAWTQFELPRAGSANDVSFGFDIVAVQEAGSDVFVLGRSNRTDNESAIWKYDGSWHAFSALTFAASGMWIDGSGRTFVIGQIEEADGIGSSTVCVTPPGETVCTPVPPAAMPCGGAVGVVTGVGALTLVVAGNGLCASTDAGASWTMVSRNGQYDAIAMTSTSPPTAYVHYASSAGESLIDRFTSFGSGATLATIHEPGFAPAIVVTGSGASTLPWTPDDHLELVAGGSAGITLALDAGSAQLDAWTPLPEVTELDLDAACATSPANVWLVGNSGVVLH